MENLEFKDNLAYLLKMKGMKAVDLSRASGVTEASISEYLRGKKKPVGKTCIALAKGLGVTLDELLGTPFTTTEKPANSGLSQERQDFINMVAQLDDSKFRMVKNIIEEVFRERER